jgi:hypothetical protein
LPNVSKINMHNTSKTLLTLRIKSRIKHLSLK